MKKIQEKLELKNKAVEKKIKLDLSIQKLHKNAHTHTKEGKKRMKTEQYQTKNKPVSCCFFFFVSRWK